MRLLFRVSDKDVSKLGFDTSYDSFYSIKLWFIILM